ncbi:MAG: hypothetical protein K0U98_17770 [Deltaproteobacteria bacterium]|nr:hypothetical protein [Deltaproteobacteria bacterium]
MLRLGSLTLIVSMLLCVSPVFAQILSTGQPLLLDANGLVVGPVIDYEGAGGASESVRASMLIDGRPLFINLANSDLNRLFLSTGGSTPTRVVWESFDCTGQPYFRANEASEAGRLAASYFPLNTPNLSLWVIEPGTASTSFVFQSFINEDGVCDGSVGGATEGFPAVEILTSFVGPYRLGSGPLPLTAPASVPAVSPLGLTVLAAFILGAAVWVLRRGNARQALAS